MKPEPEPNTSFVTDSTADSEDEIDRVILNETPNTFAYGFTYENYDEETFGDGDTQMAARFESSDELDNESKAETVTSTQDDESSNSDERDSDSEDEKQAEPVQASSKQVKARNKSKYLPVLCRRLLTHVRHRLHQELRQR